MITPAPWAATQQRLPARAPRPRAGRCIGWWRAVLVFASAGCWLLVSAGPAFAHATLLSTDPPAGYAVAVAPHVISLDFDEPVTFQGPPISLRTASGRVLPVGRVSRSNGGRLVSAPVLGQLPPGGYQVNWQVISSDGDVVAGTFSFGVGTAAPAAGASTRGTAGLGSAALLRFLLFVGLAVALGGVLGSRLADRPAPRAGLVNPGSWLGVGCLLGWLGAAGLVVHLLGAGSLLEGLRRVSPGPLLATGSGRIALAELLGFSFAALIAGLARRRPRLRVWVAAPLTAVVAAEALRSHVHDLAGGWGSLVIGVHLTAVALWVGTLLHLVRVGLAWRGEPGWARLLIRRYARLAVWLFAAVIVTGTLATVIVLPSWASFLDTGYGRVLLVKLALVAVVSVLALAGRRRAGRDQPDGQVEPGRATRGEAVVLVAVLAVTGVLVSLPSPATVTSVLAAPPAPVGPTVALGTLIGQVSVGVQASAGQLLINTTVPGAETADGGGPGAPGYRVNASLREPDGRARQLNLRGCGTGCFVATVGWSAGQTRLRLRVSAPGWRGGTATLSVPWFPVSAAGLLPRMFAAMRKVGRFQLTETVTSNTTGPSFTNVLTVSTRRFFAAEPYQPGAVPPAVVLSTSDQHTEIGFAFPAEGIYVRLVLARNGLIEREVLADPGHLILRTFTYPHAGSPVPPRN